jgi:diguanylate cyclase (GGDEF)-like protein
MKDRIWPMRLVNTLCRIEEMKMESLISLKRYLDADLGQRETTEDDCPREAFSALISAYRSGLAEFADCGTAASPETASELKKGLAHIDERFATPLDINAIQAAEATVRTLLRSWSEKTTAHLNRNAQEVKDLLLVMARTAESLGYRDDRYAHQLDEVTTQLESIASLQDISRVRASVELSARNLKRSVARMTAESKTIIEHLRVEVSAYQTKLERSERIAFCDDLTGLGNRRWIEARIQQRIESGAPFSVLMIDIQQLSRVNEENGNLIGDLLLKEFAGELRASCRFSDLVARWGGDEFIVVLDTIGADARGQVARLRSWICRPYHLPARNGSVSVRLDASFGLAEFREGDSLLELLERADAEVCAQRQRMRTQKTA